MSVWMFEAFFFFFIFYVTKLCCNFPMNPLKDDFNLNKPGRYNKECVHKDNRDLSAPTQSDTSGRSLSAWGAAA